MKEKEKIMKIIALTIVLFIVFASGGCIQKNKKIDISSDSDSISSSDIDNTTIKNNEMNIDIVDINQTQTDIMDDDLNNIEEELNNIDW